MGPATAFAFSSPYSCFTRDSANSNAVPGPRLVVSLPSTTTRSLTALQELGVAKEDKTEGN
jgi:hypothetical protein